MSHFAILLLLHQVFAINNNLILVLPLNRQSLKDSKTVQQIGYSRIANAPMVAMLIIKKNLKILPLRILSMFLLNRSQQEISNYIPDYPHPTCKPYLRKVVVKPMATNE
jgi:hypothetical protein